MWSNMPIYSVQDHFARLSTIGKIGVCVAGVFSSHVVAQGMYSTYRRVVNCKIRQTKQEENAKSIRELAERLEADSPNKDRVAYVTKLSLQQLVHELKEGRIRPIEALKAFQTKALVCHEKTNCLIEIITEAEEWALELEKGPREGALWGVPISIKDDIGIKGYDSALGMVAMIGCPLPEDGDLLKVLRKEGAIPFVKTNVPQTELSFEPGNPINGTVHNPHRHGYGPGASSSGEAALIASGGSLLGFGSDLGGSIRVPAHFCGIFGFKPTPERMSTRGMILDPFCVIPVKSVWGPLSRDMDGLLTAMKLFWKGGILAKTDTEAVPIEFNNEAYTSNRKLRVGYYTDNGITPTFSACVRAVEEACHILSGMGHEVVPWQPPNPDQVYALMHRVIHHAGGGPLKEALKYDKLDPTIKRFSSWLFTPIWLKKLISSLVYPLNNEWGTDILWTCGSGDVASNDRLIYEIWLHRRLVQDSWNEAELDVVICPPHSVASPPLGNADLLWRTSLFPTTYNLLHFPAGVVPVTRVLQTDVDQLHNDFPPGNRINDMARLAMAGTVDLPVGVMVAAPKYQDETCLRVMKVLDEGLKKGSDKGRLHLWKLS